MSLLDMQRQFRAFLVDGPHVLDQYVPHSAAPGLAVYHHAYRAQLEECMRDTFERTWAWLGDDAFQEAVHRYIEEHSPGSWTISDYGEHFADALDVLYPDSPEVGELAQLDWTLRRAFDGPDGEALTVAAISGEIDWDSARIRFVPTLRMFAVRSNCGALWSAMASEKVPPAVEYFTDPAAIRVWREEHRCRFQTIDELEMRAINAVANGASFAELCGNLAHLLGDDHGASAAGEFLATWMSEGMVGAIE
ncbi:MAG TPA: DNA-binding domain-containing protein [Dyella sp.]|uniref:DNA-binding domain-containing protein n=1 Tax=Dyella sp. TaxID=1869338 RepID=UPI002C5946A4|nr:DNA-binding domain-containing protein [Dyella sp.]HTV85962.1 DNA-binding domain-containing protein [Dyella sp.]